MLETSQSWNLFGYDLRRGVHYFRAGWSDFLWGDQSPVVGALDEAVRIHQEGGEVHYYRSGKSIGAPVDAGEITAQAIILPDHLALSKILRVPAAAEAELESVVAYEVVSSSPFPEGDTCYGWLVGARRENELDIQLVISSQSAVMTYIAAQLGSHDVHAYEVWARVAGKMVVVSGFGESGRRQRNKRRLVRMAAIAAYCLVAVMVLFLVDAGGKYLELQKVQAMHERVSGSAHDALELRAQLATSKARIADINKLIAKHPSLLAELQRLTTTLGDETWLSGIEIKGSTIKIEGESDDASAVMQQLLDHVAYGRVEAPVAIKKVRSGSERFVLNLTLASGSSGE